MGRDYGPQYRHGIYAHSAEQMAAARACVARVQAALPPGKRCHTEVVEAQVFWPAKEMHRAPHALHTPTPRPVTARLVVCSCRVRCVLAQSNTCRRAAGSAARSRRARAARIASAATADGRHALHAFSVSVAKAMANELERGVAAYGAFDNRSCKKSRVAPTLRCHISGQCAGEWEPGCQIRIRHPLSNLPKRICQSGATSKILAAAVFELLALVALVLSEYLATSILLTRG